MSNVFERLETLGHIKTNKSYELKKAIVMRLKDSLTDFYDLEKEEDLERAYDELEVKFTVGSEKNERGYFEYLRREFA